MKDLSLFDIIKETVIIVCSTMLANITHKVGGSEELTLICIGLLFVDLLAGVIDAARASKLSWERFYKGLHKVASLLAYIAIVGTSVYVVKLTYGEVILGVNLGVVFNTFILLVTMLELQSINRHFARLGSQANILLDKFFTRITSRFISFIFSGIDIIGNDETSNKKNINNKEK